jgi:hypothetical protein
LTQKGYLINGMTMKTSIQKKLFANGVQTTVLNSQTYEGTFYSKEGLVMLKNKRCICEGVVIKRTVPIYDMRNDKNNWEAGSPRVQRQQINGNCIDP